MYVHNYKKLCFQRFVYVKYVTFLIVVLSKYSQIRISCFLPYLKVFGVVRTHKTRHLNAFPWTLRNCVGHVSSLFWLYTK